MLIFENYKTKDIIPKHHGRDMNNKDGNLDCWNNILSSEEMETFDEELLLHGPYCQAELELK
ncbi:MAG: hypothetical protein ACFFB0_05420 [Promethearchaeota archaeon]